MELVVVLVLVGLVGGLLAGLVGLGGGIILAPLLLYVPVALGLDPLDMKTVARLTMLQSLFSTAAAGFAHRQARHVNQRLVCCMGPAIALASLAGAYLAELHVVSSQFLLALFAGLAIAAAVVMWCFASTGPDAEHTSLEPFSRPRALSVAAGVGFLGGMVGQSGAFLTIPLLVLVVRIPFRTAIGSSLGITFCAALAGSLGKLAGGQIEWPLVGAVVAGSLAGSQIGSHLSQRVSVAYLRYSLAALITAAAARMWYQVLR